MSKHQLQQYNQYLNKQRSAATQRRNAEQNYIKIADRITESSNGNAPYDPLRRIGVLLFALFEMYYLAPREAILHPNANFALNDADPSQNYRNLTAAMHGTQGYQPPTPF